MGGHHDDECSASTTDSPICGPDRAWRLGRHPLRRSECSPSRGTGRTPAGAVHRAPLGSRRPHAGGRAVDGDAAGQGAGRGAPTHPRSPGATAMAGLGPATPEPGAAGVERRRAGSGAMRTHGADPLVHALFAGLLVVGVVAAARVAFAAPDVIVQFEGVNDDDAATLGGAVHPPDANLAVGPDHVFEIVNFSGRISNKSGGTVTSFALDGFFGTTADEFAGDPRVLYDAISGRWFATEFAW